MDHPPLTSRHLTPQHCSNLRHKGMYVYSDATEPGEDTDGISATSYWCGCTQKAFGPDGAPVGARHCTSERGCCDH
jgi:hypothetical protein